MCLRYLVVYMFNPYYLYTGLSPDRLIFPETTAVIEASDVVITCFTIEDIIWSKNGKALNIDKKMVYIILTNVIEEDSGIYRCQFSEINGRIITAESELFVGGKVCIWS